MFAFIWRRVAHVTENYHDEGGIVAFADSLDAAHALICERIKTDPASDVDCGALHVSPDETIRLGEHHEPALIVFPDAGCC